MLGMQLCKLEKARKQIAPLEPLEEVRPASTLILVQ